MNTFHTHTAFGAFSLKRWPSIDNDPLRAWDAADELLISYLAEHYPLAQFPQLRVLLVNDVHGALSTVLHTWEPLSWSDSSLAHAAAVQNRTLNGIESAVRALPSVQTPEGPFDLIIFRVPKTSALLDDQLARLRPILNENTQVIAAGMIKHLQKAAFACFERYVGKVSTSLAKKKARLLFAEYSEELNCRATPYPSRYTDSDVGFELINHANVFSRDRLDHGARFMLSFLDKMPEVEDVVDLACGNGVLGLKYQQRVPAARLEFIDESYSAVDSARINYQQLFSGTDATATFTVADGLENREDASADLILCNPPFHQNHVVGDRLAISMFRASHRCLRRGGQLWVVANRSLAYCGKLRGLFGHCHCEGSNRKFRVLKMVKR